MNAQVQPAADLLHIARSSIIDAFAAVELSLNGRLKNFGFEPAGPFGQRIEMLRKVEASPKYSKAQRAAVLQQLDKLANLNTIRCDVVHSPLHVVRIGDEPHACFMNPLMREKFSSNARILSAVQLDALAQELAIIAKRLAVG